MGQPDLLPIAVEGLERDVPGFQSTIASIKEEGPYGSAGVQIRLMAEEYFTNVKPWCPGHQGIKLQGTSTHFRSYS